jgi:hypothetical protein
MPSSKNVIRSSALTLTPWREGVKLATGLLAPAVEACHDSRVAIPSFESLNTHNLTKAERAAELGWVRPWQAAGAIRAARAEARAGRHGDAFEILVRRRQLGPQVVDAIERDEEAPRPPWWLFWRRFGRGLFGTWNAPLPLLVAATYDARMTGMASNDCAQMARAERELRRRFALGEASRRELYAGVVAHRRTSIHARDPIVQRLDEWLRAGAPVPDDVIRGIHSGAIYEWPSLRAREKEQALLRGQILTVLFARLPRARIGLAVELALAAPCEPPTLTGAWLDEAAADPLAPIAPLVAARMEEATWRVKILEAEATCRERLRAAMRPAQGSLLESAAPQLLRALEGGDVHVCRTLGEIGTEPCLAALRTKLGADAPPSVRRAAALALLARGEAGALATLRELLAVAGQRRHVRRDVAALCQDRVLALQLGWNGVTSGWTPLPERGEAERLEDWFLDRCVGRWGPLTSEPASVRTVACVSVSSAGRFGSPGSVSIFELSLDDGSPRYGFLVLCLRDDTVEQEHADVVPAHRAPDVRSLIVPGPPATDPPDVAGLVAYALATIPEPVGKTG